MPFFETDFPGLLVFEPVVFEDSRGYFFESYSQRSFTDRGMNVQFVQDNESSSTVGVIRGLHYQLEPHAQVKLIRVIKGRVLDVVVDIRKGSPTFGQSYSVELNDTNKKQLFIPQGFAHGFSVLSAEATVLYKCNSFYNKQSEAGFRFDDPQLRIDWKIPADQQVISEKDMALPLFANCINNFVFSK